MQTNYFSRNEKLIEINFLFLFLILTALSWQSAFAGNTELFTSSGIIPDGLETSEIISPAAVRYEMVDVDINALNEDSFEVSMLNVSYDAITSQLERSDGKTLWRGKLLTADGEQGSATFTVLDGYVAGYISTPDGIYELVPHTIGQSILMEIDPSLFPPEHPPEFPYGGPVIDGSQHEGDQTAPHTNDTPTDASEDADVLQTNDAAADTAYAAGGPTVDMLVVYTPAARSAAGGTSQIRTVIQNAVNVTNTSYSNSGVPQRMRLVHMAEVSYTETGNIGNALNWVDSNSTVATLRNTHGADLVQLIVNNGGGYCGLAYVMRTVGAGFANSAFAVTARTCAVGNLSFAHEAGHNMGLEHDPANGASSSNASYPYAFGHFVSGKYRTVMSYSNQCTGSCPRAQYFSNPSVSHQGSPTGIANQRDNARALRNTDAVTAAFRLGKPDLISPNTTISDTTPTYRWNAEWGATWYRLYVNGPSGNVIDKWYTASTTGCSSGTGICSITPSTTLSSGGHTWWVQAYKSGVYSPWSISRSFTISSTTTLGKPTLVSPTGTITDTTPAYRWNAVSSATWYRLWVNGPSGNVIATWYTASATGCTSGTGTCSITPSTVLASGGHTWWVQAYNAGTYSPWSSSKTFTVSSSFGKPSLISPTGTITDTTPAYRWNAVSSATWYRLYVNGPSGNMIDKWYTASTTGCSSGTGTCSITPSTTLATGGHTWWVQAYNAGIYSPWSSSKNFTVGSSCGGSFNEHFNNNSVNAPCWKRDSGNWNVTSNAWYYTAGVANNTSTSTYNSTYSNVNYRARIWRTGANTNASAIIIRASGGVLSDGNYANQYAFQMAKNGNYSVWKRVGGTWTPLRNWTTSSAIKQGNNWNELRVWANGSSFWFYINGTLVWNGTDSSLSSGRVGVRMYRDSSSTGNGLWVDYALLSVLGADEANPVDEVNAEQSKAIDNSGAESPDEAL